MTTIVLEKTAAASHSLGGHLRAVRARLAGLRDDLQRTPASRVDERSWSQSAWTAWRVND